MYSRLKRWPDAEAALDKAEQLSTKEDDKEYVDFLRGSTLERQKKFPGLVLHIGISGVERLWEDGKQVFEAGAGVVWDALVAPEFCTTSRRSPLMALSITAWLTLSILQSVPRGGGFLFSQR